MELTAAISALEALNRPCEVEMHTDSQYLRDGVTGWMSNWKGTAGAPRDKKPVKNEELWRRLDEATRATKSTGAGSRATPAIR